MPYFLSQRKNGSRSNQMRSSRFPAIPSTSLANQPHPKPTNPHPTFNVLFFEQIGFSQRIYYVC
jgi:hypothetical protein